MEEEEEIKTLPEDLVEKIVAMVQFPSLFKARVLSKSWMAKFSPISASSSQPCNEEEKSRATFFHRQATVSSRSWGTFCPVLVGKGNFIAFDKASHSWRRMPSLSYLPENLVLARVNLQIEGSFLYGFAKPETRSRKKELYVTNIFTRSWKQLPPRPKACASSVLSHRLVIDKSTETYKVIMFCREDHQGMLDRYSAQIYDSNSDAWSIRKLPISSDVSEFSTAHLNGIVYMVAGTNPRDLLAFNVKDESLEELTLSLNIDDKGLHSVNLVVCDAKLMMFLTVYSCKKQSQLVLSVDLHSRSLVEIVQGPPDALRLGWKICTDPVSDGNSIFFGMEDVSSSKNRSVFDRVRNTRLLEYRVQEDMWAFLPDPPSVSHTSNLDRRYKWNACAFQPGLGPFVAV